MKQVTTGFILALAVLALSACGRAMPTKPPPPFPAQCDAKCYTPCVAENGDTGLRIQGDPAKASTFDEIGETAGTVFATILRRCEVNRQACVQCLDRLERAKVISK